MATTNVIRVSHNRGSCRRHFVKYRRASQLLTLIFAYLAFVSLTLVLKSKHTETNEIEGISQSNRVKISKAVFDDITTVSSTDGHGHGNCTERAIYHFPDNFMSLKDTQHGGVTIHILLILYTFGALAIVCDDYFVPSLEHICTDFGIHEDIAGATFMAAGSSAPELFTSVIGVFIAKNDVGVGTIVGSAVFNILFIVGLCGLTAGMVVKLTMWPLIRDCFFYLLSIVALIVIIDDEKIHWYEGMTLLLMYIVYIVIMYFNQRLETQFNKLIERCCGQHNTKDLEQTDEKQPLLTSSDSSKYDTERATKHSELEDEESIIDQADTMEDNMSNQVNTKHGADDTIHSCTSTSKQESEKENDFDSPWDIPENMFLRIVWVAMIPVKIFMFFTIPDCRRPGWRKFYFATFVLAIVWIAVFSYAMVWMVTIAGDALNITDSVMGLTLIAAGTSIPDCLSSILVAKDGYGDMAVSNCIGSNVFDILICLGLPWFLDTVAVHSGEVIEISSSGLLYSSITLLLTVVFLLIVIHVAGWKLNKTLGVVCIIGYVFVTALSCLYELNIFGNFTLPPCPRHT